jgi:hypothetical protein
MGREFVSLRITAAVSRHNSPADVADNRLWNQLIAAVAEVAARPEYTGLVTDVDAEFRDETDRYPEDD